MPRSHCIRVIIPFEFMSKANFKVHLKDVATVRLGYPFRTRVERDPNGTVGVIQMKDIDGYNRIDLNDVYKLQIEDLEEWHLLQANDILFRSRGVSNTAAFVDESLEQTEEIKQFVASAPLMVIEANNNVIDPFYLLWYINHPHGQRQMSRLAKGTNQQMVSKAALETMEVELPGLEKQRIISKVAALSQQEQELLKELTEKRKAYIDAVLLQQVRQDQHAKA